MHRLLVHDCVPGNRPQRSWPSSFFYHTVVESVVVVVVVVFFVRMMHRGPLWPGVVVVVAAAAAAVSLVTRDCASMTHIVIVEGKSRLTRIYSQESPWWCRFRRCDHGALAVEVFGIVVVIPVLVDQGLKNSRNSRVAAAAVPAARAAEQQQH